MKTVLSVLLPAILIFVWLVLLLHVGGEIGAWLGYEKIFTPLEAAFSYVAGGLTILVYRGQFKEKRH